MDTMVQMMIDGEIAIKLEVELKNQQLKVLLNNKQLVTSTRMPHQSNLVQVQKRKRKRMTMPAQVNQDNQMLVQDHSRL